MAYLPQNVELFEEERIQSTKRKLMDKMRWNSLFQSVGDTCKFVAGPLMGVGIGVLALGTAPAAVGLSVIAAGVALLTVGIASSYASSRIWQSAQFDNLEVNAKSTAEHLVEKIKENNLCLTEHPQNQRKDGKSWVEATCAKNQQQAGVEAHGR
jgi:hypothetical protein